MIKRKSSDTEKDVIEYTYNGKTNVSWSNMLSNHELRVLVRPSLYIPKIKDKVSTPLILSF